ncbi:MAG: homoserine dehydrogenase [bacterium]
MTTSKSLQIGIIGFGTVGTGLAKTLLHNREHIAQRAGMPIEIRAIADINPKVFQQMDLAGIRCTTDAKEILTDDQIDCVVELVGGTDIAEEFVIEALHQGKDVVTANKALLAIRAKEIFRHAEQCGRKIHFEAAVGGGIPVIQTLYGGISAATVAQMHCIINGTCNYILTEMEREGRNFDDVLREAQELGYAEADPTFDIDGHDAGHKIAILASLAYGTAIDFEDVCLEGIRDITVDDIRFGKELGYTLKLLAIAKDHRDSVEVRVHPTFIPTENLLASVHGVHNAVYTCAPGLGAVMLYGRGAGDLPTGNAVASDLIQVARDKIARHPISYRNFYEKRKPVRDMSHVESSYYLKCLVADQPGVIAAISKILGEHQISILSMMQTEAGKDGACPIVLMTHEAREGLVKEALEKIAVLEVVKNKPRFIRLERIEEVTHF